VATNQPSDVSQLLRSMLLLRDGAGLTDGQLLEGYISNRDEGALAALVGRHAPMVWGVCRRVLRHHQDAEDAFQATFLVFVRKATSIASPELLASWLYGVAYQTALNARTTVARRRARERQVAQMPEPEVVQQDLWNDLQPLLDQELSSLPAKYRILVVLCDLEGKTRKEAAQQLGCPEGTVAGRLARARVLLARRLARRGLAVSDGALAAVLAQNVSAAGVPASVLSTTIGAVSSFAADPVAAAGVITVQVATLTQGVLTSMLLTKLKIATAVLLVVVGLLVAGLGALALPARAQKPAAEQEDNETEKSPAEKQDAVKVIKFDAQRVGSLSYCNNGKTIALALGNGHDYRSGGSVVLWDVQTEKVQHTLEKSDNFTAVVAASRYGTTIAVASAQFREKWHGAIKVWDAGTGKLVKAIELDGLARAVAVSADGAKVIGGANTFPRANGKLFVWDVKSGEVLQTLEAEGLHYSAVAISDDGKWIVGAGDAGDPTYKGKVIVWEVETGKVKHEWANLPPMYAVAISPDGKQVVAAGAVAAVGPGAVPEPGAAAGPDGRVIRVWDMQTGKLKHQLKPEGGHVITGLVFSPDGETLAAATAGIGANISFWDLAKERTRVTLPGHGGHVWCVAFSPDGRTLASSGADGTMRFWPSPAEQPRK
jgi:RNA polymerase sigma factor (sigma-70 family)